jgi:hypothetical protein
MDNNLIYLDNKVTGSTGYITYFSGSSPTASAVGQSLLFQTGSKMLMTGSFNVSGSIFASSITASFFKGDGSQLTGVIIDKTGLITTGSSITIQSITGSLNISGSTTITGSLFVTSSAQTLGQFVGNNNGFVEFSVRNTSTGVSASGDIAVYADNGTPTSSFIDIGINNSGIAPGFSFGRANDSYVYNTGGNLYIGNNTGFYQSGIQSQSLYLFANSAGTPDLSITGSRVGINKGTGSLNATLDVSGSVIITGSLSQGLSTSASGNYSHTEGGFTIALGLYSHAEGFRTTASFGSSHAEGESTLTLGAASHAEGYFTTTFGDSSHAEGRRTLSSGSYSHAEGYLTMSSGSYSHAEGYYTTSSGDYSHAEGIYTISSGSYSHAEGNGTLASGEGSHTEGYSTIASGDYSHAEGDSTISSGEYSHAEGSRTRTPGDYSHAEGRSTISSGSYSHAEGYLTMSSGSYSHAEGQNTRTLGIGSHAEGYFTTSSGDYSHAEGYFTVASGAYQHVQGTYNISSSNAYATIIGNGTSNANRSNLLYASGSQVQVTGSVSISNVLTLSPQNPLPSAASNANSFAVSSSGVPFFSNGSIWTALF